MATPSTLLTARVRELYATTTLTQSEIARRLGISQAHVSRLARGVARAAPRFAETASGSGAAVILRCDGATGETVAVSARETRDALWPFVRDVERALSALYEGATIRTPSAWYEANSAAPPGQRRSRT